MLSGSSPSQTPPPVPAPGPGTHGVRAHSEMDRVDTKMGVGPAPQSNIHRARESIRQVKVPCTSQPHRPALCHLQQMSAILLRQQFQCFQLQFQPPYSHSCKVRGTSTASEFNTEATSQELQRLPPKGAHRLLCTCGDSVPLGRYLDSTFWKTPASTKREGNTQARWSLFMVALGSC